MSSQGPAECHLFHVTPKGAHVLHLASRQSGHGTGLDLYPALDALLCPKICCQGSHSVSGLQAFSRYHSRHIVVSFRDAE